MREEKAKAQGSEPGRCEQGHPGTRKRVQGIVVVAGVVALVARCCQAFSVAFGVFVTKLLCVREG